MTCNGWIGLEVILFPLPRFLFSRLAHLTRPGDLERVLLKEAIEKRGESKNRKSGCEKRERTTKREGEVGGRSRPAEGEGD